MSTCSVSSRNSNRSSHGRPPLGHCGKLASAFTPADLLQRHSLPIAAYFCSRDAPPGLDISQPFLLYKNYSSTKVRAASLRLSKENGLLAVGPTLVIPDTYSGWFSIVSTNGRTASYFSTVEELTKGQPTYFLTRYDVPGYVKEFTSSDRNRMTYRKFTIQSGQVLKLLGVYEDLKTKKGFSDSKCKRNNYIQCLSHKNEILFIPFSATGKFYETAPRNSTDMNHVFLMSQILGTFQLPLTVRLVCGYMSRVPESFTGILRLERIEKESVILASTITPEAKATLLEMDVSSSFFLKPITDPSYMKSPIFLKSISFCSEEADTWQRQVKIIHNVTRDRSSSSLGRFMNNRTVRSNSLNLNLSFVNGLNKVRGRVKERKRHSSMENNNVTMRDQSRDASVSALFKINQEKKESRYRESKIKNKVFDKIQDMSRNRHSLVNNEFISIRMEDKLSGKKSEDSRKISKQNTYVLQNEKLQKKNEKKRRAAAKQNSSIKSVESQNYATVADDITHTFQDLGIKQSESVYSEICNYNFALDSVSTVSN